MKLKKTFGRKIEFIIFFLILISSLSAVSYLSSSDIFDAKITYLNSEKMPYSVILEIQNEVSQELRYNVEINYKKENLVVASQKVNCDSKCEVKLELSKIFFDEYEIVIRTKYQKKLYEKILNFNLEKKENQNIIEMPQFFFLNETQMPQISGTLILENESKVILDMQSLTSPDIRFKKTIDCNQICNFNIELNNSFVLGEYKLFVYLPSDMFSKKFYIKYKSTSQTYINENTSLWDKYEENVKINLPSNSTKQNTSNNYLIEAMDVLGEWRVFNITNDTLNLPQGYVVISTLNSSAKNNSLIVNLKPKLRSYSSLADINFSSNETLKQKKIETEGLSIMANSFDKQSIEKNVNPIVDEQEKIYINDVKKYIELDSKNLNLKTDESRKLVPGIYKREKLTKYKDGTEELEENFFAYGLISINTKKTLYKPQEIVEFLIVVLDKNGFLVSNANISLIIASPNNTTTTLSTQNFDIVETSKQGVYSASFIGDSIGKYDIHALVELNNMEVEVKSYFNIAFDFDFDIQRIVPATIDPWQGPFENEFSITPLINNYDDKYDFTEVFSSDFDIIKTDADEIKQDGDSTYLIWHDLYGKSKIYYIAQTPLKSPYLYYLGKSWIDYNVDDRKYRFYENRSWLFAIDPAAKECSFDSPCICGSNCVGPGTGAQTGSHEPTGDDSGGYGTIDTCSDGDTSYEYTTDIRITDLNGSYFGVGDTVQICSDYNCDTSYGGDRITIGYKDASSTWANSNIIYETGNTYSGTACIGIKTYCVNQILNNYVGVHNIRSKIVWNRNAGLICDDGATYRDHDDVNITVLAKIPANFISWELNNITNTGNNLNVIRGNQISVSALWDKPLQFAKIRHNSTGSYSFYTMDSWNNNITNYTFNTANTTLFPYRGTVTINLIQSSDKYFNLTGNSTGALNFYVISQIEANQSNLYPVTGYAPLTSSYECQFTDKNVNTPIENLQVDFFSNNIFIGSNFTNSSGWGQYTFTEASVGHYNITCNISDVSNEYVEISDLSSSTKTLIVQNVGGDITLPIITNVTVFPSLFSIGGITTIRANVTDDVMLSEVFVNIRKPDSTTIQLPMNYAGNDYYEMNFSQTTLDGIYNFYIYAIDNSSNPAYSSNKNFEVTGVRTFIGIQSTQAIFKLGESLNLSDFSKVSIINSSSFTQQGDINNILYTFNSNWDSWTSGGTANEWERGVPSSGFNNMCDDSNCLSTDLDSNYNVNSNQWVQSPQIDFTGRENIKITYWRSLEIQDGTTNDRAYFEGYDGSSWLIYYQDSLTGSSPYTLSAGTSTYYLEDLEGVSDASVRFRLTSNGNTQYEGWAIDTVNITFDPRVDWQRDWNYFNSSFGSDTPKITAIKLGINISAYNSAGSDASGTASPDLEVQVYNGTGFNGDFKCSLDSTKSYPYYCEVVIKNTPQYLVPWRLASNRMIRIRVVDLDMNDEVTYKDIKKEYVTPSIIENNGIGSMTAYLLAQFKNSTGGIISTLNFAPIFLASGESRNLSDFWTYKISGNFKLGNYSAYVAITDANGTVLQNEDDGSYINDSYDFSIQSLLINPITPLPNDILNESFALNISLDTSSYGSGGACFWYTPGNGTNVSMTQTNSTNYIYPMPTEYVDGSNYQIIFYCNDSDGDFVDTGLINFSVSEPPRLGFVPITDLNDSYVNRSYTFVNVSINDSSFNSAWLNFNNTNISLNCSYISGINYNCFTNISRLKNGKYEYMACANDSLNNIGCSGIRTININKTLPIITILNPISNYKYSIKDIIFMNISTDIQAEKIWCEFNHNGTIFYLYNISSLNWTDNTLLRTASYNMTCSGNDSIGNILPEKYVNFWVLPDKDIFVLKNIIESNNDTTYFINLTMINYGTWVNYTLIDFVDINWHVFNQSVIPDGIFFVNSIYEGDVYYWNFSLSPLEVVHVYYYINKSTINADSKLMKNVIISSD